MVIVYWQSHSWAHFSLKACSIQIRIIVFLFVPTFSKKYRFYQTKIFLRMFTWILCHDLQKLCFLCCESNLQWKSSAKEDRIGERLLKSQIFLILKNKNKKTTNHIYRLFQIQASKNKKIPAIYVQYMYIHKYCMFTSRPHTETNSEKKLVDALEVIGVRFIQPTPS